MARSRHGQQPEDAWLRWSYSKLDTLFTCPFQFWCRYIFDVPYTQSPIAVVGSALHFMAKEFFGRSHFESAETFASQWRGFWMGVVKGEHGPEGFGDNDIPVIDWSFPEEPNMWIGKGSTILMNFFKRNAAKRGTGVGILREKFFSAPWRGFRVNGQIDRVDLVPGGAKIVDYKMGILADYMLIDTLQKVCYTIGFEEKLRNTRAVNGRGLVTLEIENIITGKIYPMPLCTEADIARFHRRILEASAYVKSILTGEWSLPEELGEFQTFNTDDVRALTFRPRLPRGNHCKYCRFIPQCREWEAANHKPTSMSLWVAHLEKLRQGALPAQLALLDVVRQRPVRRKRSA